MKFNRMAGIAGLVFIVLIIVNMILSGNMPMSGDSMQKLNDYVSGSTGRHKTGLFIGMLVLPPAVLFFSGIVAKVRASDREHDEAWSVAFLLGAVLLGASAGVGDVFAGTALFRGGNGLDDATLRALWDGQTIAYASTGIALTTLTLAVAVPTVQHRIWPMWHAGLGLIAAVLGVLGLIAAVNQTNGGMVWGFISFIAMLVWILATSALLIIERPASGAAA